jgi:hypothetical protein
VENNPLFSDDDLASVLAQHRNESRIKDAVNMFTRQQFEALTDEEILSMLLDRMTITPIVLNEYAREFQWEEVGIHANGSWDYPQFVFGGHVSPGVRAHLFLPYTGSTDLWRIKPRADWPTDAGGNIRATSESPALSKSCC